MAVTHITFTGVDGTVSGSDLFQWAKRLPCSPFQVELGFLFSLTREGSSRYPQIDRIPFFLEIGIDIGVRTAVHVCGEAARLLAFEGILHPRLSPLVDLCDRVQINVDWEGRDLEKGLEVMKGHPTIGWILQSRDAEKFPTPPIPNLFYLFDASGGRGKEPVAWPPCPNDQWVGYAGGLGPGRVGPLLKELEQKSPEGKFWVDMESSLFEDGKFELSRCTEVLHEANKLIF